jgi:hypothetical protein
MMPMIVHGTGLRRAQWQSAVGALAGVKATPGSQVRIGPIAPMAGFYGKHLAAPERLPFALYSSVASLSLVVVIGDIGVRTHSVSPHVASALLGAGLLSVLLFLAPVGALRPHAAAQPGTAEAMTDAD